MSLRPAGIDPSKDELARARLRREMRRASWMHALIWLAIFAVAGVTGFWALRDRTSKEPSRPDVNLGQAASGVPDPMVVPVAPPDQAVHLQPGPAASSTGPATTSARSPSTTTVLAPSTTGVPVPVLTTSPVTGGDPALPWAWASLSGGLVLRWLVRRARPTARAGRAGPHPA
jgi:hypothetical protein